MLRNVSFSKPTIPTTWPWSCSTQSRRSTLWSRHWVAKSQLAAPWCAMTHWLNTTLSNTMNPTPLIGAADRALKGTHDRCSQAHHPSEKSTRHKQEHATCMYQRSITNMHKSNAKCVCVQELLHDMNLNGPTYRVSAMLCLITSKRQKKRLHFAALCISLPSFKLL